MITFHEALDLYLLIKPFLPETQDLAPIDFIDKVVENIQQANKPEVYLNIVSILQHTDIETILEFTPDETLQYCLQGLINNKIYELINFFGKDLGL